MYIVYILTSGFWVPISKTLCKSFKYNHSGLGFMKVLNFEDGKRLLFWPRFATISHFYDYYCTVFIIATEGVFIRKD